MLGSLLLLALFSCSDNKTTQPDDTKSSAQGTDTISLSGSSTALSSQAQTSSEALASSSDNVAVAGSSATQVLVASQFTPSGKTIFMPDASWKVAQSLSEAGTIYYTQTATISPTIITKDITIGPNVLVKFATDVRVQNGATLTVLPGSILLFGEGAILSTDASIIKIQGSQSAPVRLGNLTPGKRWGGVSADAKPSFGHSSFDYAVLDSSNTGMYIGASSTTITHCAFTNNLKQGINLAFPVTATQVVGNQFMNNGTPMQISAQALATLSADQTLLSSEPIILVSKNYINLPMGSMWPKFSVPYLVQDSLIFSGVGTSPGSLEIQAGTQFLMTPNSYMGVYYMTSCNIKIAGTKTQPVLMGPATPGAYWGRPAGFNSVSGGLILGTGVYNIQGLIMDYALSGIFTIDPRTVLRGNTFRNSKQYGIYFSYKTDSLVSGNSFENDGYASFMINIEGANSIGRDNLFSGPNEKVKLTGETRLVAVTLVKLPVPYLITSTALAATDYASIPASITVEPGVHFLMQPTAFFQAMWNGQLVMNGTAADPIVFENATPGLSWGVSNGSTGESYGILPSPQSRSEFSHIIFYGAQASVYPIYVITDPNNPNTVIIDKATIQSLPPR